LRAPKTRHGNWLSLILLFGSLTVPLSGVAQGTFNEAEQIISSECYEEDLHLFLSEKTDQQLRRIQRSVPLDYNEYVENYIQAYTGKRKITTEKCLGRSQKYFPQFEEVFARYGVPDEMKYLAVIESALNPLAVSKKGATGIFQFMLSTAKIYGLSINKVVDERRDTYLSAEAAAKYLLNSYNRYGNWLHVIASYNCGPGNVDKAIKRAGGSTNFWDIYPYLPKETRGYVPAFIATVYAMTYHRELGINVQYPEGVPVKTTRVQVENKIMLNHLRDRLGMSLSELKYQNPSLLSNTIPKGFYLTLPEDKLALFQEEQEILYAMAGGKKAPPLQESLQTASKQAVEVPASKVKPEVEKVVKKKAPVVKENKAQIKAAPEPEETGPDLPDDPFMEMVVYSVKPGDNLGYIADWFHCSVQEIMKWNGLKNNKLAIGRELMIFVPVAHKAQFERFEYLSTRLKNKLSKRVFQSREQWSADTIMALLYFANSEEKPANNNQQKEDNTTGDNTAQPLAKAPQATLPEEVCFLEHHVRKGDILWDLSRRYKTSINEIRDLNDMGASSALKPGMVLKVARKKCG
jgi:LysM repeat protein